MTIFFRLGATTVALLSMMLASSPSPGGEVWPGRWQIREPSGATFLQFVLPDEEVYLTLFCLNKGSTEVNVSTPVGSAVVKAGQTTRLMLKLPTGDSVNIDAKLDKNGDLVAGQIGLRVASQLLLHAEHGPLAIEVPGAEALLNVNNLGRLAERFVNRCN